MKPSMLWHRFATGFSSVFNGRENEPTKKWRIQADRLNDAEKRAMINPTSRYDIINNASEASDEELDSVLLELVR